jgi:hypothetical protein
MLFLILMETVVMNSLSCSSLRLSYRWRNLIVATFDSKRARLFPKQERGPPLKEVKTRFIISKVASFHLSGLNLVAS